LQAVFYPEWARSGAREAYRLQGVVDGRPYTKPVDKTGWSLTMDRLTRTGGGPGERVR
jgi:hypothetical protein